MGEGGDLALPIKHRFFVSSLPNMDFLVLKEIAEYLLAKHDLKIVP